MSGTREGLAAFALWIVTEEQPSAFEGNAEIRVRAAILWLRSVFHRVGDCILIGVIIVDVQNISADAKCTLNFPPC